MRMSADEHLSPPALSQREREPLVHIVHTWCDKSKYLVRSAKTRGGVALLKQTDNQLLTQVSPGTPMGELMRRYWHPVAAAAELDDSPFRTKGIRILGEDLVLYRDRSGQLGLITRYCPHRRVDLGIGVVEQDGLRCQYE